MPDHSKAGFQTRQSSQHYAAKVFHEMPARGSPFVQAFLDHIKATGEPETYPGLHNGPLKKSDQFWLIADFEIDGRVRSEGDRAPCPLCHHQNKFLRGWLVFFPSLKAVAAIGSDCADQKVAVRARRHYKEQRDREHEENFLLSNLPLIPTQLRTIRSAKKMAAEAVRIHGLFRREGNVFLQQLRQVKKHGGQLTLTEEIDADIASAGPRGIRGSSGSSTRDLNFGTLGGETALLVNYNPVAELKRVASHLNRHDGWTDEEAALRYTVELSDRGRHNAYVDLFEAGRLYAKFASRLEDFVAFFSAGNFISIAKWAAHEANPDPFRASWSRSDADVIVALSNGTDMFRAIIGDVVRQRVPEWPSARG